MLEQARIVSGARPVGGKPLRSPPGDSQIVDFVVVRDRSVTLEARMSEWCTRSEE
jgi:hypothetical protein